MCVYISVSASVPPIVYFLFENVLPSSYPKDLVSFIFRSFKDSTLCLLKIKSSEWVCGVDPVVKTDCPKPDNSLVSRTHMVEGEN